ncbi:MAG: hypothetical protein R2844_04635 [Caldilineales bacterium]
MSPTLRPASKSSTSKTPPHPLVDTLETGGTPVGVAVSEGRLFIADGAGLSIASLGDPAHPVLLGAVQTPDFAAGVAVHDTYAYVADSISGLQVVDIADPTAPAIVGSLDSPGVAYDLTAFMTASGMRVQLADGPGGLRIIDASNPALPVETGHLETPGDARDIDQAPGQGYIADTLSLIAFTAPDPTSPAMSGLIDPPGYVRIAGGCWRLRVSGIRPGRLPHRRCEQPVETGPGRRR